MAYSSLRHAITDLEKQGELIRVSTQVSTVLEITEIIDRLSKSEQQNKAVLFENTGTKFSVLINLYGSQRRMENILGVSDLDAIAHEIIHLFETFTTPATSWWDKLKLLPQLKTIAQWMPSHKKGKGAAQEVVMKEPDITKLPVLTCWPADAAPFITLPSVHTQSLENGQRNVGMYRMQVLDNRTTAMHWHMHKGGAAHFEEYKRQGKKMPIAVTLGGDPIYTYVATAPLPEGVDEYLLAGFLRKKRVELCRCLTQDIEVPADVDIVIEGYIDPQEPFVEEGPFGDHTGYYSLPDNYPKFHITAITHRKDAVYPTTIVGIPPQEDAWIGKTTERIFLPLLQIGALPELVDMEMPFWGVAHNLVIASVRNRILGTAHKIAHQFWGAGQMAFNKTLIVVDETVDVHNEQEVLHAILQHADLQHDILFSSGMLDVLDHAALRKAFGGKWLIDATNKEKLSTRNNFSSPKIWGDSFPSEAGMVYPFFDDYGAIVQIQKKNDNFLESLSQNNQYRVIVLINMQFSTHEIEYLLWQMLNNIEVERDVRYINNHKTLLIDATHKNETQRAYGHWPNMLKMKKEIIHLVDEKWERYGLGEFIKSPSQQFTFLKDISDQSAYFSE